MADGLNSFMHGAIPPYSLPSRFLAVAAAFEALVAIAVRSFTVSGPLRAPLSVSSWSRRQSSRSASLVLGGAVGESEGSEESSVNGGVGIVSLLRTSARRLEVENLM